MNVYAPLRIRRFIRLLGWPRPTYGRHVVRGSLEPKQDGMILRWYDSGNYDYALLEINLQPNVRACVFAIRYRLCTGWYEISPLISDHCLQNEVQRLDEYLAYKWFSSNKNRHRYRLLHPECSGWTWKRLRSESPPFYPASLQCIMSSRKNKGRG